MSLQHLPELAIEERLASDPGYQLLQMRLHEIEQQLTTRAALKDDRSDNELMTRLRNEREQIIARLNDRKGQLGGGHVFDSKLPRDWRKKHFNGTPYYIVLLTAGGDVADQKVESLIGRAEH